MTVKDNPSSEQESIVGWRGHSEAESTCCIEEGLEFVSKHPYWETQKYLNLAPRGLLLISGL